MYCRLENFSFWSIRCLSLDAACLYSLFSPTTVLPSRRQMVERRNEGKQTPHFDLDINCNNWLWPPRILVKITFSSIKHEPLVGFMIISNQGWMMVLYIETIFGLLFQFRYFPKYANKNFSLKTHHLKDKAKEFEMRNHRESERVRERQGEIQ